MRWLLVLDHFLSLLCVPLLHLLCLLLVPLLHLLLLGCAGVSLLQLLVLFFLFLLQLLMFLLLLGIQFVLLLLIFLVEFGISGIRRRLMFVRRQLTGVGGRPSGRLCVIGFSGRRIVTALGRGCGDATPEFRWFGSSCNRWSAMIYGCA